MMEYRQRHWLARTGELGLWAFAAVVVVAAHAGAVALMMQEPEVAAADDGSQSAIMIELAAEPEAVETEEEQIVPDEVDAEEVKTAAIEPLPEPQMTLPDTPPPIPQPVAEPVPEPTPIAETPPEPVPEPDPEPEVEPVPPVEQAQEMPEPPPEPLPEPPPEPVVEPVAPEIQQVMAELENVEVPLPVTRPPPPAKEPPPKKVAAAPPVPPASQAARKAKAEVTQSDRTAARETSSGRGPSVAPAQWQSRLMSHLERRKRYPSESRANKEQGTVTVRFSIDPSGNVLSASISRSSGFSGLDQAVLEMVQRASPVPAPPPGVNRTIVAPVKFSLR